MGLQVIFVVESDKKSKSDWIYIKGTIDRFYHYDQSAVKLKTVYMGGKRNYKRKQDDVNKLKKMYRSTSKNNESIVVYCFDCDEYDKDAEDKRFLETVKHFCEENKYLFAWFCKDIERVYLGTKVKDSDKKKLAESFIRKNMIRTVEEARLKRADYAENTSNLLYVIDNNIAPFERNP